MHSTNNLWDAGIQQTMEADILSTIMKWDVSGLRFIQQLSKNLTDAQYRTADNAEKVNINSAVRIYRVYLMSVITDIHGDVPYSEAGKGFLEEKFNPRYDTQEEIYNDFFTELKTAGNNMDASKDKITGDVIFNGDVSKWKKTCQFIENEICHAYLQCRSSKSSGRV